MMSLCFRTSEVVDCSAYSSATNRKSTISQTVLTRSRLKLDKKIIWSVQALTYLYSRSGKSDRLGELSNQMSRVDSIRREVPAEFPSIRDLLCFEAVRFQASSRVLLERRVMRIDQTRPRPSCEHVWNKNPGKSATPLNIILRCSIRFADDDLAPLKDLDACSTEDEIEEQACECSERKYEESIHSGTSGIHLNVGLFICCGLYYSQSGNGQ